MSTQFESPQDAEDSFYDAFEAHDLDAMMAVWDDQDDIACVQPMGPVLLGKTAVRDSWQKIFQHKQTPDVQILHRQWIEEDGLAVHIVEEKVAFPGGPPEQPALIASNVYRHTGTGWRLVFHQVSPPAMQMQGPPGAAL